MKGAKIECSQLSCGQQALWYLNQIEPHSTAYHLGICLETNGPLNEHVFSEAWADIVMAHPQLRARFILESERPAMVVDPAPSSMRVVADGAGQLERYWKAIAEKPFDLANESPIRALLVQGRNGQSHLLYCAHHIVSDLWSSAVILRGLSLRYQLRVSRQSALSLPQARTIHTEFAATERQWLEGAGGLAARGFWKEYFAGASMTPILTQSITNGRSGAVPIVLEGLEAKLVKRAARKNATTPYAILLACYAKLLGEETGRDELVIGTSATLRDHAALRDAVGYYVNAVPVRCPIGTADKDSIGAVIANARNALKHRRFPFPVLVEHLGISRTPGVNPIFQTMFAYQALPRSDRHLLPLALNQPDARWEFGGGITMRTIAMPAFDAKFPIALTVGPIENGFFGSLQYDGCRVAETDAARLAQQFPEIIREYLTTKKPVPAGHKTADQPERLDHLFDATARRMCQAPALCENGMTLSYAAVKTRAEAIANNLDALLPALDRPVAVQMPSSSEAAIIILAILKSGRAFQPIDRSEPEARRNAAILRTGACALFYPAGTNPGVLPPGILALQSENLGPAASHVSPDRTPSEIAYLIQTSGSTGEPKVVEVGHASVINHSRATARIFGLRPKDRVLQFHTLAFDAAYEEIFPAWSVGACVVFAPQAKEFGIPAFLDTIQRAAITILNLPTSYWHVLAAETARLALRIPATLRLLVVGGESASPKSYSAWRKLAPNCRWLNTYGPTEATITALTYEPPPGTATNGTIPIGRPIAGISTLLLNESGDPISIGEGELLLGGIGLARGYWRDAAMTARKFVTRVIDGKKQRFYHTGDRVRLGHDGNFEYLGRIDRQLKIRGFRIEPDEIERVLRSHPSVSDAVVFPHGTGEELALTGWISRANASFTESQLRRYLAQTLPPHLIPATLNFVERIPRKPNGKVNGAAWADALPHRKHPEDSLLREMTELFSELLEHPVGPQDDFFQSGGHSLLGIKLLGRIEIRFGRRISPAAFVAAPTAEALWRLVQSAPANQPSILQDTLASEIPISAQQSRALLAHEIGNPSLANIVLLLQVDGHLDKSKLARAIKTVASETFLLRAGFRRTDGGIVLRNLTNLPRLESVTLTDADLRTAAIDLAQAEGRKPFLLDGESPWIRLLLVSSPNARSGFLLVITHHAIADGWAFELLFDDLRAAYEGTCTNANGPLKIARDYRVYALQQHRWRKSPTAHNQILFWKECLAGAQAPHLPFRRQPSPDPSWQTKHHEVTLPLRLSGQLRRVATSYGTTPFSLAMACFQALIHRHAGQCDIAIGSMVSNRFSPAEQNIFGPLQNPVLIRSKITADLSLRDLTQRIARSLSDAQANGALPFENVLREALPQHSATLVGAIQFLSHDQTRHELKIGTAFLRPLELPPEISPFELSIGVSMAALRARINFEYRPAAYPSGAIKCLAQQYIALLQAVVKTPDAPIAELNIIPTGQLRALERRVSKAHVPQKELLQDGFESHARKDPGATAVISRERRLTYGELDLMSELTAQVLAESGLKKSGLVAVMLPKGWEQIVACLAILKAGGVYVPLDPALPRSRVRAIVEQGGFDAVIATDPVPQNAAENLPRIPVITIHSQPRGTSKTRRRATGPNALAYIIFTSGTTGIPKGVMISHQAAMTTIAEMNRRFQLRAQDRVLAVSALGFDLSVYDIFGTLRAGGTIVMPSSQDPREWLDQASTEKVTVWNSVPCLFESLLDEATTPRRCLADLRLILLSGDFISVALARRIRAELPDARVIALGGATEGAIWSIAHEIKHVNPSLHRIPYGRALRRQEMFVLDDNLNHCARGVIGELFIGGAGLAAGYWNNSAETKRRFLRHPRWKIRLYRTGDKGRYFENGEIEILGRSDDQLKVNGVRIEPGDVEAALSSFPKVRHTIVEVRGDALGNKKLIAFVAADSGINNTLLLEHAKKILPGAMIPATVVVLDRLPLTSTGKIDRAALRTMKLPVHTNNVETPGNSVEVWIANLWSELLGATGIGANDDFFALGGHSLLAIRMLQRVRSHFAVELPISLIVECPTVRGLAAAVTAATTAPKTGLAQRATAELERDTEPVLPSPIRSVNPARDAVFLTGVTGHLGLALLAKLLTKTKSRIYCLVRANSTAEANIRIQKVLESNKIGTDQKSRIIAIPGDLRRNYLGLEHSTYFEIVAQVRAIYHCAAEVNFIASYENLFPTNVGGTREMIRLASAADAVLHHISSVAVFPYGGARVLREDEDITQVRSLIGGYAQSKWASERMVWKALARGMRAVIYRPAQIVRRRNGSPHDLFDHTLQACQMLRAVPDIETKMDLVTSDYAAAAVFALSTRTESLGRAFHLVHPDPISLRDFVALFPTRLPIVPLDSWRASLDRMARRSDNLSLHFVSMLLQGLGRADLSPPQFDCCETTLGLSGTGVLCPPLDQKFILREFTA
ncbi:MAG TPA: amino acid adenylation domain-containing protein [Chthoniobacterales bacterium]|jgi:amino acid adenylation domain-containing protein/thioester reductase-like protein